MKIKVIPEGREGLYMVTDKESLKDFIKSKNFEHIHNMVQSSMMVIGADHSVESVLNDIDKGERIAVLTGDAVSRNLGHSMAIADDKLEMYDIGEITEEDLDVQSE